MKFSQVLVRENSKAGEAAWFNDVRASGLAIENTLGAGYVEEKEAELLNNQAAPADLSSYLNFDTTSVRAAFIDFFAYRNSTVSGERVGGGRLIAIFRPISLTWEISPPIGLWGDDLGVSFSMSGSKVQYASDPMDPAGYGGKIRFKATTFGLFT